MKIKKVIQELEWKVALYFAGFVFLIVLLLGILNGVPGSVILKRIILSEMLFIPMGYGIGILLKPVILSSGVGEKDFNIEETYIPPKASQEETSPVVQEEATPVKKERPQVIFEDNPLPKKTETASPNLNLEHQESKEQKKPTAPFIPKFEKSSPLEELKNLKSLAEDKSLGKYMIIDDKKIINEPEIMAKAVRTMLNREE